MVNAVDIDFKEVGERLSRRRKVLGLKQAEVCERCGISDKYLSGILIGYTKDVSLDVNNLTQSGYLVPAVDFEHLQEVLIITKLKDSGN